MGVAREQESFRVTAAVGRDSNWRRRGAAGITAPVAVGGSCLPRSLTLWALLFAGAQESICGSDFASATARSKVMPG